MLKIKPVSFDRLPELLQRMPKAELHRACVDAQLEFGISASLILCFLRHLREQAAFACLEQAMPLRDKLLGIGLASSELGHPPEKFARKFGLQCPLRKDKTT